MREEIGKWRSGKGGEGQKGRKRAPRTARSPFEHQTARVTFPERRHRVQTYTWRGVPFTIAFTRFTLGFQARLERLWEWETLMPKVTPLSQNSHFAIRCTSSLFSIANLSQ